MLSWLFMDLPQRRSIVGHISFDISHLPFSFASLPRSWRFRSTAEERK